MSVVATVDFFVKPEKLDEFCALLKGALPDTRKFEGCELVEVHEDQDEPGHLHLFERWGERAQHEAYLRWRTETGMLEHIAPYMSAPPAFRYFDARPEI